VLPRRRPQLLRYDALMGYGHCPAPTSGGWWGDPRRWRRDNRAEGFGLAAAKRANSRIRAHSQAFPWQDAALAATGSTSTRLAPLCTGGTDDESG
jgi:hypothetical protein